MQGLPLWPAEDRALPEGKTMANYFKVSNKMKSLRVNSIGGLRISFLNSDNGIDTIYTRVGNIDF